MEDRGDEGFGTALAQACVHARAVTRCMRHLQVCRSSMSSTRAPPLRASTRHSAIGSPT
ncbi:unnamed protein product [Prorocentrum cordatum]|uniref:Uncharacterized protein n=2 Tax=Prorocentrum cordatum TaxID=2364126 RepID=A0ABN9PJ16_9DINO|nr:unnamed protein product [Polarella glacialis]